MEEHDSYHEKETEAYLTFRKSVSNLIEVEQATIISFIHKTSNLQQANILDFGCGSGLYSRLLRKMTRGDVYGTDISESMLETAKSFEDKNSANQIIYKKADLIEDSLCSVLEVSEGFFDVVITTWVLCYSENVASLKKMVKNIAKPLKSGGKVYGITMNPDMTEQDFKNQYKYHRAYVPVDKTKSKVSNEDKLIFTMFDANTGEKTLEVPVYYYDKETLKRVFEEEGFRIDIFGPIRELSIKPEIYEDRNTGVYFELTKIK